MAFGMLFEDYQGIFSGNTTLIGYSVEKNNKEKIIQIEPCNSFAEFYKQVFPELD